MKYDSILHHTRVYSAKHPPMSNQERAAQFAPFAALTGLEAAVEETARLTEQPVELTEEARQALDETLQEALRHPETPVQICYFRPDEWKSGGAYVEKIGTIRRIDVCGQMLEFADGEKIPLETIRSAGDREAE